MEHSKSRSTQIVTAHISLLEFNPSFAFFYCFPRHRSYNGLLTICFRLIEIGLPFSIISLRIDINSRHDPSHDLIIALFCRSTKHGLHSSISLFCDHTGLGRVIQVIQLPIADQPNSRLGDGRSKDTLPLCPVANPTTSHFERNFFTLCFGEIRVLFINSPGCVPSKVILGYERDCHSIRSFFQRNWVLPDLSFSQIDIFGVVCTETWSNSTIDIKNESPRLSICWHQIFRLVRRLHFPVVHCDRGRRGSCILSCVNRTHELRKRQDSQHHNKRQKQCHDALEHHCFLHLVGSSLGFCGSAAAAMRCW